jgi:hypothetical protein
VIVIAKDLVMCPVHLLKAAHYHVIVLFRLSIR